MSAIDVDTLLDELDCLAAKSESNTKTNYKFKSDSTKKTEFKLKKDEIDLDELLNEFDLNDSKRDSGRRSKVQPNSTNFEPTNTNLKISKANKCLDIQLGQNQTCNSLRCVKCDFKCLTFVNSKWSKNVDYLFFRNHCPIVQQLSVELIPDQKFTAYCCQCSWESVDGTIELKKLNSKWVCGHK
ncbi:retinal maintenance-domain-containing protein [Globomyces pollinis-pini]|nr:retinal maintenance-domain-containing protein [Globomyces pollinis-pini]